MFQKKTLKNGLRLLTIPVKGTDVITVLVLVKAGSRYENDKIAGISHFAEHMFFKGTKKRPNSLAISTEIDGVGGEVNAFTSKEFTGFYIKISKKYLELAIDVLSDLLRNPLFREKDIEKEKGVIIQEINMYQDLPMQYVGELLETVLFSPNQLGQETIGTKEAIKSIKKDDFKKYLGSLYQAENIILTIAGGIEKSDKIEKLVNKYFHFSFSKPIGNFQKIIENQKEAQLKIKKQKTEQTHFCLGIRGYSADDPKRYALEVLATILGGGMSSRLFEEVREKHSLAYYIKAINQSYEDCGYLFIQAGVEHEKINKALSVILKELALMKNVLVSESELKKAKEYLKGKLILEMENSFVLAELIGLQELLQKKTRTPEEIFKLVDKVSSQDIKKVAKELFIDSKLNLAVIGPHTSENPIKKLLKF